MSTRQRGFTMIELMMVVAVVGILATIALVSYSKSICKVRSSEALAGIWEIQTWEGAYHAEAGRYASLARTSGRCAYRAEPDGASYSITAVCDWDGDPSVDASYALPAGGTKIAETNACR